MEYNEIRTAIEEILERQHEAVIDHKHRVILDFAEIITFNYEIGEIILDEPEQFKNIAKDLVLDITGHNKQIRIKNIPKSHVTPIRDLRVKHLEHNIGVEGVIRFSSEIKRVTTKVKYECVVCPDVNVIIPQYSKKIVQPKKCKECGNKRWRMLSKEQDDMQKMQLEEPLELLKGNAVPRTINVVLTKDLLEPKLDYLTTPGNRVIVWGVLKEDGSEESTEGTYIIEANFIEPVEENYQDVEITAEDEKEIMEKVTEKGFLSKVIASFAPHVHGYEDIKKALLLQAVSGYLVDKPGKKDPKLIHLLMVGDPGTGKTELAKNVKTITPKYRYANGTGATSVGLLAGAEKDEFFGGWVIKAGAVVMANKGTILIDEFDKMPVDTQKNLNEALSEFTITKDAGGAHAILKCETSVLAVANPKYGRFDTYENLPTQINMDSSLVNRFDLIYLLRDVPGDQDLEVIRAMYDTYEGEGVTEDKHIYSPEFIRKYISYAKKLKPKWPGRSSPVADFLTEKYVEIRDEYGKSETKAIPISARQADTLFKLSTSVAKLKLHAEVELEDVQEAYKVLMGCLRKVALDEKTGTLDVDLIGGKTHASERQIMQAIVEILRTNNGVLMKSEDIFESLDKLDDYYAFEKALNKLVQVGDIYQPKVNQYQLMN